MKLKLADTTLAHWLAKEMSQKIDAETEMPGISQRQLAKETNVSQAQIHEILKRGHIPTYTTLFKLADFFDTPRWHILAIGYLEVEHDHEMLCR